MTIAFAAFVRRSLAVATVVATATGYAQSTQKLRLPELVGDNMVLQRGKPVPVWGWAAPGTAVEVAVAGREAHAVANAAGRWQAQLPSLKPGGPFELTVTAGPEIRILHNVLVGDVWFASGQSNMEWGVGESADAENQIATANYPEIHLFDIPPAAKARPQTTTPESSWKVCTPATIVRFSAAAYFFGRDIHETQDVPVGLINASVGGTAAELWTSREALATLPDFAGRFEPADVRERLLTEDHDWKLTFDHRDEGLVLGHEWWRPAEDDSAWECQVVPGTWEQNGLEELDGIVWYRTAFDLPSGYAGKLATLDLGPLGDNDLTWVNGQQVGSTDRNRYRRQYPVPAGVLQAGYNVIAVRLSNRTGPGGFLGKREDLFLEFPGSNADRISLADPDVMWRRAVGIDWRFTEPKPYRANENYLFSCLYNAMVAPVIPYGITGVIWYQGEANAPRAQAYRQLFPALIGDWRGRWGDAELPFIYVQLAGFRREKDKPSEDPWAELREAQSLTLAVPHTAMITAIDIGDPTDIHPWNKLEVGRRLALAARATVYGEPIEFSGPMYRPGSLRRDDDGLRVSFTHAEGLTSRNNGRIRGFAVAGTNRKWQWADASIDGDSVVLSSPKVPNPVAVRYAWAINPRANLINSDELPALPFRTDDWPGMTDGVK